MNNMQEHILTVSKEHSNKRVDIYLNEQLDISRSFVKKLIANESLSINSKIVSKAGVTVKEGDVLSVLVPEPENLKLEPENIPIDIVYEDDDIIVINKAQNMVVHPAPGANEHTLVNALLYHAKNLSDINGVIRPGIVHRLDKDTTGLIVVAKNNEAHISLQEQISNKEAKRYYKALVDGVILKDEGVITTLIDRSKKDRKLMAVSRDTGRIAITHYKVIQRYRNYTFVEYELKTGRTHQIRVHSKHIGHTVVGDPLYGGSNKFNLSGQLLHAYKLELTHPKTKERMTFMAPLPAHFEEVLAKLN